MIGRIQLYVCVEYKNAKGETNKAFFNLNTEFDETFKVEMTNAYKNACENFMKALEVEVVNSYFCKEEDYWENKDLITLDNNPIDFAFTRKFFGDAK